MQGVSQTLLARASLALDSDRKGPCGELSEDREGVSSGTEQSQFLAKLGVDASAGGLAGESKKVLVAAGGLAEAACGAPQSAELGGVLQRTGHRLEQIGLQPRKASIDQGERTVGRGDPCEQAFPARGTGHGEACAGQETHQVQAEILVVGG